VRWGGLWGAVRGGLPGGAWGGGGALRAVTGRRSAEQALDSTPATTAPVDSGYRVPAFVEAPVAAAPAVDTAKMPASAPEWTVGVVERAAPGASGVTTLREVRAGRNQDFDRVVVDFGEEAVPAFRVEYGVLPVRSCGSGEPVAVEGAAALLVRLRQARAHDESGAVTIRPDIRAGMPSLRQVVLACDFEGQVVLALGVAAANKPYHVLVERAPNRLIVDVRQ
jgi:hypothetical protein